MRNFTLRGHVILRERDLKGILKLRNNSNNVHLHQMTGESRAEVFTNSIRILWRLKKSLRIDLESSEKRRTMQLPKVY
jgi:hypothetical protein